MWKFQMVIRILFQVCTVALVVVEEENGSYKWKKLSRLCIIDDLYTVRDELIKYN